ncbi:hypothetical protein CPLU01_06693 [Colletotrichum plurivorum]|uniref:Uncharacterized protein n=1 Tax=Colletotrichum plurivorum TaxID=2175906 RepID=A0A8H6NFD5_9PEZI|nr:hypothetical protein CPLU01_06693 [Colletotrichum plurivorum]
MRDRRPHRRFPLPLPRVVLSVDRSKNRPAVDGEREMAKLMPSSGRMGLPRPFWRCIAFQCPAAPEVVGAGSSVHVLRWESTPLIVAHLSRRLSVSKGWTGAENPMTVDKHAPICFESVICADVCKMDG